MSRTCCACGTPATRIRTAHMPRHTITANGREFHQMESFHSYWCALCDEAMLARLAVTNKGPGTAQTAPAPSGPVLGGPRE